MVAAPGQPVLVGQADVEQEAVEQLGAVLDVEQVLVAGLEVDGQLACLLYTSPSPRDS